MKLVLVGAGELADIAEHYWWRDYQTPVMARCVDDEYVQGDLVSFENLIRHFPPEEYVAHVAVSDMQARKRLYEKTKGLGYQLVSYVSPRAYVDSTATAGENCFIFEDNTIQYKVKIGDNVVLWSGNHIGHQTKIGSHCFITSHVVISGFCEIEENCYFGVNSCLADNVKIGGNTLIGMGAVVHKSLPGGKVYVGNPARELRNVGEKRANLSP